jgi:hypothetical protein
LVVPPGSRGESTCRFTASNALGEKTIQVSHTVLPPGPQLTASFVPAAVRPGDSYELRTNASSADQVSYVCSGARQDSGSLPAGATTGGARVATQQEIGTVSCTVTAKNTLTGQTRAVQVSQVIGDIVPSISVTAAPSSIKAGSSAVLNTSSANATSVSFACTGGISTAGALSAGAGSKSLATTLANVGTTVCAVTATSSTGRIAQASASFVVTP